LAWPTITQKGDVEAFYKDWGTGRPVVFGPGWPLAADDCHIDRDGESRVAEAAIISADVLALIKG